MISTNILKFVSVKDTFVKVALVIVAATIAITFGTVSQASAHSGHYTLPGGAWATYGEGGTYRVRIDRQNGSGYCTFDYQVGEAYGVIAYGKFKVVARSGDCSILMRARTPGQQPAGTLCAWYSYASRNGCTGGSGWNESLSNYWPSQATQHAYTNIEISVGPQGSADYFTMQLVDAYNGTGTWGLVSGIDYCGSELNAWFEGC